MGDLTTEDSTGGLAAFINGLKEKPIETLVHAGATMSYIARGVPPPLAKRSADSIMDAAKQIVASPSTALKIFIEDVKKDPIGTILSKEAPVVSIMTGMPLPIAEGMADSVGDALKGIVALPSTVVEISKVVVKEVMENPAGVAKAYFNFMFNPMAKIDVIRAIGGALVDGVKETFNEIINAATLDDKLRLIAKLLTDIGLCFIPVGGAVSKAGKVTVGATKANSFWARMLARLKPKQLVSKRKPVKAVANEAKIVAREYKVAESAGGMKSTGNLFRGDDYLYSPRRPNGIRKPYLNSNGDIIPANANGIYKGRKVTVTEHVLGGYRSGAKSNSPYTSFCDNKSVVSGYGDSVVEVDLPRLMKDINKGKIKDVEVLTPKQVRDAISADNSISQYWKDLALKWTTRDNEYLVKGVIPKDYIIIPK